MHSDLARRRFERFTQFVEATDRRARWLVLTHDNPDPDALASATSLARILRTHFKRRATVAYGGIIGRAENREMQRSLRLELSRMRHINLKHYRHVALVDCQPHTGNNQLPTTLTPDVVIDHHPRRKGSSQVPFLDLRTDYGATASILAEYLLLSGLRIGRREATGIVYAIRSETLDFSRESPGPDRQIYDHLLTLADKRALGRIQQPRLPLEYYATLHRALERLEGVENLILSHLGPVQQPDIVPEIADFLLRLEGRTWSLVTGCHEERLYCSIRTTNPRANASRIMRRLLGRKGKGGGHGMIAGGWLPLVDDDGEGAQTSHVARRFCTLLRKNPDRLGAVDLSGAS